VIVWGLKNCDTCRKARAWLDERSIAHAFRDVRADGVTEADIAAWIAAVGADTLVNRRGTTWRGLDEATRVRADDPAGVTGVLAAHPAVIKRPVFVAADGAVVVGFGAAERARLEALR